MCERVSLFNIQKQNVVLTFTVFNSGFFYFLGRGQPDTNYHKQGKYVHQIGDFTNTIHGEIVSVLGQNFQWKAPLIRTKLNLDMFTNISITSLSFSRAQCGVK